MLWQPGYTAGSLPNNVAHGNICQVEKNGTANLLALSRVTNDITCFFSLRLNNVYFAKKS